MENIYTSIHVKIVRINDKKLLGIEISLPNAPPLLVLRGDKGFIMCGYLDIGVAEKLGLIAGRVTGVKSIEEVMDKEIVDTTSKAREHGIKPGVRVKDIIDIL